MKSPENMSGAVSPEEKKKSKKPKYTGSTSALDKQDNVVGPVEAKEQMDESLKEGWREQE